MTGGETSVFFLILRHTVSSNGRFRRVGLCQIMISSARSTEELESEIEELRKCVKTPSLTEELYVSHDPHTGCSTIEIE